MQDYYDYEYVLRSTLSLRRIIEGGENEEAILSLRGSRRLYIRLVPWESVSGHKSQKWPQVDREAENDDGERERRVRGGSVGGGGARGPSVPNVVPEQWPSLGACW